MQNSYCTGESGVALSKNIPELGKILPVNNNDVLELNDKLKETTDKTESITSHHSLSSQPSSSSSESENKRKEKSKKKKKKKKKTKKNKVTKDDIKDEFKKALEKEEERLKEVDRIMKLDERKRPYNSMYEVAKPTDEEIEAYHMKKRRDEDPMSNFM